MFTNAKTVMINNKEVQSIITSNGGVIYKNWKLNLTSDKQIIQTGETATLTATLTHGGTGVSGETIYFNYGDVREDTYTPYEGMTPTNYTVYTVVGDGEINFANGRFRLVQGNIHDERVGAGYPMIIRVSNSQLSIKYVANGQEYSVSGNSQIDLSESFEIWIENTVYSNTFTLANASGVTDSNGVATVSYTGKGTGKLNIKCINGTLQSETYGIIDALYYDTGLTGTTKLWFLQNSDITKTVGDSGTTISNSNSSNVRYACAVLTTATSLTDTKQFSGNLMIEVDIIEHTNGILQVVGDTVAQISLSSYGAAPFTMQMKVIDGTAYYYDGAEWVSLTSIGNNNYAIRFGMNGSSSLKFKNFKIYPI